MRVRAEIGPPAGEARLAVLLVHGRGASAAGMMGLADALHVNDVHFTAPQAPGGSWYPHSFLAPLSANAHGVEYGLETLREAIDDLGTAGLLPDRIALVGFSQGACLALEFAARNPRRYAAVAALSGGLIGNVQLENRHPPEDKGFHYSGSLEGTPVLLGCSDVDAHIPIERVHESARVLSALAADVDLRIYPGMGHTINEDELQALRALLTHADGLDAEPRG